MQNALKKPLYYTQYLFNANLHDVGPRMSRQSLPATRSILGNPTKKTGAHLEKGKLH